MPVSIRLTRNSDPKNDDVIIIRKRRKSSKENSDSFIKS